MQERLQKILARAGVSSRRGAEELITGGRVSVNGDIVRELGTKADITTDDVRVDGVRLRAPERPVHLLLYKPKGYVTTRHDPQGRPTVMDLVPAVAGLFPVGRLDVTTEGLILLTNDGEFAERVAHPRYEVPRVYHAKVRRVPDRETLARLRQGVMVEGERMAVDHARVIEADNNAWVELTLHEGKHHEVKRLLEAVGHPVSKLKRVALGPLTLRGMAPGEFRSLSEQEIKALRQGGAKAQPRLPRPKPVRHRRPAAPAPTAERPRREDRRSGGRSETASRTSGAHRPAARRRDTRSR